MVCERTMQMPRQHDRQQIAQSIHAVCWDRNLNPDASHDTEVNCRIERLLPELIRLAEAVGPDHFPTFESAVPRTICLQCGNQDALGRCPVRAEAECCVYRYLPLLYEAIHRVSEGVPSEHGCAMESSGTGG